MTKYTRNRTSLFILAILATGWISCQDHPATANAAGGSSPSAASSASGSPDSSAASGSSTVSKPGAKPDLRKLHLSFANPKDPSCGMPLTAGLEDTARYKGKLYGFCSKECKEAFLKDPETSQSALK